MSRTYDLYGGAITTKLPPNLLDVSTIRQIPDAQEIFLNVSTTGDDTGKEDESYIVEILEMIEPTGDNHRALEAHLAEINELNEVESDEFKIGHINEYHNEHLKTDCYVTVQLSNLVKWSKKRSESHEGGLNVVILSLIRLAGNETDIIITGNVPIMNTDDVALLKELIQNKSDVEINDLITGDTKSEGVVGKIKRNYDTIVKATQELKVIDFNLFC